MILRCMLIRNIQNAVTSTIWLRTKQRLKCMTWYSHPKLKKHAIARTLPNMLRACATCVSAGLLDYLMIVKRMVTTCNGQKHASGSCRVADVARAGQFGNSPYTRRAADANRVGLHVIAAYQLLCQVLAEAIRYVMCLQTLHKSQHLCYKTKECYVRNYRFYHVP